MIRVDPEDQWLLDEYKWFITAGYAYTWFDGANVSLCHFIVGQPIDPHMVVDHIDRDKLNNSRSNLRYITRSENVLNAERSDRAKLVYRQASGRWFTQVTRNFVVHYGGTFDTHEEAVKARDRLLKELGGK